MFTPGLPIFSNRVRVQDAAAAYYNGAFGYTAGGYLAIRTDAVDGNSIRVGGFALKDGRVHTTQTVGGTDIYIGGVRVTTAGAIVIAPTSSVGDPLFGSVVSLLHLDGADAATTITDVISANTWTARNNAQLDTAIKKFGTAALIVDGTNDRIDTPDSVPLNLGASDFCIEGWIYPTSLAANRAPFSQFTTTGNQRAWTVRLNATQACFDYSVDGVNEVSCESAVVIATSVWSHIAVNRSGAALQIFINGVQAGITHSVAGVTIFDSTSIIGIGERGSATQDFFGSIDEFRLTKASRYTANFTPPDAPFPNALPGRVVNGNPCGPNGELAVEIM